VEHCFIWLRNLDTKKIGAEIFGNFEIWCWRRMEKTKWLEKVTIEQVLNV
jgi:hypothetical protein